MTIFPNELKKTFETVNGTTIDASVLVVKPKPSKVRKLLFPKKNMGCELEQGFGIPGLEVIGCE